MKIGIIDGSVIVIEPGRLFKAISDAGLKWNKRLKRLEGQCSLELLESLSKLFQLPPRMMAELVRLQEKQDRIISEKNTDDPVPAMDFPVNATLYKHQIKAVNMALEQMAEEGFGFGFLFDMGCGKTLTTITLMGCLYKLGKVKRVLVIAPSSVVAVWPKDLQSFAKFAYDVAALVGDKKKRLKLLNTLNQSGFDEVLRIAVINYESVWRDEIFKALVEFDADMIICDESQRIKTHNAVQSKAIHKLGDIARYKIILSGTPVTNNCIDLYSQYRFMDKSVFGTNFYSFKNRYCVMGGFNLHQIVAYKNQDELIRKAHSVGYRVTKEEALDLPEQTFENRYVVFSVKERKLYDELKRNSIAELDSEDSITASTVLTKLLRLQQMTGGFVNTDEGALEQVNSAKLDALKDILEDYVLSGCGKLVIFARFTPEINAICKMLEKAKIKYVAIHGQIPTEQRGGLVEQFQTDADTKVFVAQLQCANLGITLTAASVAVYYSLNFNYADYGQSLARIHRIGQKNNCHYIHLLVEDTIDDKCMKALEKKEDIAKSLVDDWKNYF